MNIIYLNIFSLFAIVNVLATEENKDVQTVEDIDVKVRSGDEVVEREGDAIIPVEVQADGAAFSALDIKTEEEKVFKRSPKEDPEPEDALKQDKTGDDITTIQPDTNVHEEREGDDNKPVAEENKEGDRIGANESISEANERIEETAEERPDTAVDQDQDINLNGRRVGDNPIVNLGRSGNIEGTETDSPFEESLEVEIPERNAPVSEEVSSKIAVDRHGMRNTDASIFIASRRLISAPDLVQGRFRIGDVARIPVTFSKIGSSRRFSSGLVSPLQTAQLPLFNPQTYSGTFTAPNVFGNTGYYHKPSNPYQLPRYQRSGETSRDDSINNSALKPDENSYPYTSNQYSSLTKKRLEIPYNLESPQSNILRNSLTANNKIPNFYNMFDQDFSPVRQPLMYRDRLRRNAGNTARPIFGFIRTESGSVIV